MAGVKVIRSDEIEDFIKHDDGKLRWDLLPMDVMGHVITVLMHGAAKYDDDNWKKGADYSRYYNSAMRHLTAWFQGEDLDLDSGLNHLDHAMCCLIFLRWYQDRPQYDKFDNRED